MGFFLPASFPSGGFLRHSGAAPSCVIPEGCNPESAVIKWDEIPYKDFTG